MKNMKVKSFAILLMAVFLCTASRADNVYEVVKSLDEINENDTYMIATKHLYRYLRGQHADSRWMGVAEASTGVRAAADDVLTLDADSKMPDEFRVVVKNAQKNEFFLKCAQEDKYLYYDNKNGMTHLGLTSEFSASDTRLHWELRKANKSNQVYIVSVKSRTAGSKPVERCILYSAANNGKFGTFAVSNFVEPGYVLAILMRKRENVHLSAAQYAGYVTTKATDFTKASGLTAYQVTSVSQTGAVLQSIEKAPAHTGVVLFAPEGSYDLHGADGVVADMGNNLLKTGDGVRGDGITIYSLANADGTVGFYRVKAGLEIPASKPYLVIPDTGEAKNCVPMVEEGQQTTGVTEMEENKNAADSGWYTLSGCRVVRPSKGIYIHNGKKIIVR